MKKLFVLALIVCQWGEGSVLFYFQESGRGKHVPSLDTEWELSESGKLIHFTGYCETLRGQEDSGYSTVEAPPKDGCHGVNAPLFYQRLHGALGIKDDRTKNKRRLKALQDEGFGDAVAPYQQEEISAKGIDELGSRFLRGTETAACLDGDSNKLADIGLTCRALQKAFQQSAAENYKTLPDMTIREGIFTDERGIDERYLKNAKQSGLVIGDYGPTLCKVERISASEFQLKCLQQAKAHEFAQTTFQLVQQRYQCDAMTGQCETSQFNKDLFPRSFKLLSGGILVADQVTYSGGLFSRNSISELYPIKPGTPVVFVYAHGEIKGQKNPPNEINPQGPDEEVFWKPDHTYASGLGDIYWAYYTLARRLNLNQMFGGN